MEGGCGVEGRDGGKRGRGGRGDGGMADKKQWEDSPQPSPR